MVDMDSDNNSRINLPRTREMPPQQATPAAPSLARQALSQGEPPAAAHPPPGQVPPPRAGGAVPQTPPPAPATEPRVLGVRPSYYRRTTSGYVPKQGRRVRELSRDDRLRVRVLRDYEHHTYQVIAAKTGFTLRQVQHACSRAVPLTPRKHRRPGPQPRPTGAASDAQQPR